MYIASYYVLTIHVFSVVIIIKYSRQITVLYMYIYIYIYIHTKYKYYIICRCIYIFIDMNNIKVWVSYLSTLQIYQWRIQKVFNDGIPVWAPKLCAQINKK